MKTPERILVRGPNFLGDHVMAQDFYAGLRARFPRANLSLLVPASLTSLQPATYDEVIPLNRETREKLKATPFDLAVNLPASVSSAYLLWSAKIPQRFGFGEPLARLLLTRSLSWRGVRTVRHKSELYTSLLSLFDEPPNAAAPVGFTGVEVLKAARQKKIVIAPGASIALREWPYYVELAAALRHERPEFEIELVGSSADQPWGDKFKAAGIAYSDQIGKTTLPELVARCVNAALVIGNDSGVAHLAATVAKAPTLVLFGPGNPIYVKPLGDSQVARIDLPCSPCESARCKNPKYQQCLTDLSQKTVLDAALKMLSV